MRAQRKGECVRIAGGTVLDGSGGPPREADVVVAGGRIRFVGRGAREAGEGTLDARGCVVCPGFIDTHGHSDFVLSVLPTADSAVRDGVTTQVCSSCGYGPFPLDEGLRRRRETGLRELAGGADVQVDWHTGEEFLAAAAARPAAINRLYQVAHGNLRIVAGAGPGPARGAVLERMAALLRRDLPGTSGLSSGLAYAPGAGADRAEMRRLAGVLAEAGGLYTTHIRDEGDGLMEAIEEAIDAGRAGARLHISHVKTMWPRNWAKIEALEVRLHAARAEGVDLTADRYPYTAAASGLDYILPTWVSEGGADEETKRLAEPEVRARLLAHLEAAAGATPDLWGRVRVSRTRSGRPLARRGGGREPVEGRSIAELARRTGRPGAELVLDLLAREHGRVDAVYDAMSEENLERILSWDFVTIGSDSGVRAVGGVLRRGQPHPRTFGTFARFLRRYSALSGRRGAMPLARAVRKATGLAAERFGLADRGRIEPGLAADLVVFDPDRIEDRATFEEPFRYSAGIRHVLVNGEPAVEDEETTGALAGRVLRPVRSGRAPVAGSKAPAGAVGGETPR
jgi:N-acyl-D-amino-acid deacylase